MFSIFLVMIIIVLVLIVLFDAKIFRKLKLMDKISNNKIRFIVSFLPIVIILFLFNYVNAVVIFIHLAIFYLISIIILKLLNKLLKKEYTINMISVLAIILTTIYLGIGAYLDYHVFETHYTIDTTKELGQENLRIIQISDSHIGTTFDGNGFYKHMEKISKINSDLFVITGDFVDDDTTKEDMIRSCEALSLISSKYGVYYIYGNHDRGYFNYRNFSEKDLINELEKNNVIILKDEVKEINDYIYLIGRDDKTNTKRKTIDSLIEKLDSSKFIIDLNHQPNDYDNEQNKVDLVLSGHSHGGQLFPLGYIGLLMGSNDEFDGIHKRENTTFIVNSGISDWAIDFKTGTYSEYVIVDIKKK